MAQLIANPGTSVRGGGLYVSDSLWDSIIYGACRMEVSMTTGTPYVSPSDDVWTAALLGVSTVDVKRYYSSLGRLFPLLNYHYSNDWSVFYSSDLTRRATGGTGFTYNTDLFNSLFNTMYPRYNDTWIQYDGPKLSLVNNFVQSMRQIVLSFIAAENPLRWLAAVQQSPDNYLHAIQPNASKDDWELFERVAANAWRVNRHLELPRYNDKTENAAFWEIYVPAIMGAPVPMTADSMFDVLRDYPYSEEVWATQTYLDYLETENPFVNVVGVKETMNFTTSGNRTLSLFKVVVRGISAFQESDWKKLFQLGVFSPDHPVLKLLTDPTICCEGNKTQLLVYNALRWLGHLQIRPVTPLPEELVEFYMRLSWILPFKESVIPSWMSRSLMRLFVNRIPYMEHRMEDFGDFLGMSEAVQYVRCAVLSAAPPPNGAEHDSCLSSVSVIP